MQLAAIVRNEMQNPAGGIKKFLERHLPLFDSAILLDTGSTDGILECLQSAASNDEAVELYQKEFEGFGTSRNYLLSKATSDYVMWLDADEVLLPQDFHTISAKVGSRQPGSATVKIWNLPPEGVEHVYEYGWSERIMRTDQGYKFERPIGNISNAIEGAVFTGAGIFHLVATKKVWDEKKELRRADYGYDHEYDDYFPIGNEFVKADTSKAPWRNYNSQVEVLKRIRTELQHTIDAIIT